MYNSSPKKFSCLNLNKDWTNRSDALATNIFFQDQAGKHMKAMWYNKILWQSTRNGAAQCSAWNDTHEMKATLKRMDPL